MKCARSLLAIAICAAAPGLARGDLQINEIMLDAPFSAGSDNGQEYFEIISTTGDAQSVDGLRLLVIESDIGGGQEGQIDDVISLNSLSTGANGLLLMREGGTPTIPLIEFDPQPAADTQVSIEGNTSFAFENTSAVTYVLVEGFTGANGDDLDANNDGLLDTAPWANVLDAVAVRDTTTPDFEYATQLGGVAFPILEFSPDTLFRDTLTGEWLAAGLTTVPDDPEPAGGFFPFDPNQIAALSGAAVTPGQFSAPMPGWSPGLANPSLGAGGDTPGDFNGDGYVDSIDYALWRENLGGDESTIGNNGDGLDGVDQKDFELWLAHYGASTQSHLPSPSNLRSPLPTPEPASIILLAMLSVLTGRAARRSALGE